MNTDKMEGIILKATEFKESSKILHLLTIEGKKSVLLKGAKKINNKYRYMAYPLNYISYISSAAKLPTFIDGDILDDYKYLKEDLTANLYANNIIELAYLISDSDIDFTKLYPFTLKCLDQINKGNNPETISFIFELKILYLMGVGPSFKECVHCGKKEMYGFSFSDGGVLCKKCACGRYSHLEEISHLYYLDLSKDSLPLLNNELRKEIRLFIDEYYRVHLGIKTKSHMFF